MSNRGAFASLPKDVEDDSIVVKEKKVVEKKPKKAAPAKKPAPAKKAEEKKPEPAKKAAPAKKPEAPKQPKIAEDSEERRPRPPRAPKGPRPAPSQRGTGNRPPKREFDRHDGTGRAHEGMKKGGAGRGNWGKPGDEAKPEPEAKPRELTEEEKHEEEIRKLRAQQKTYTQYACQQAGQKEVLVSKEGSGAVEKDTTELKPIEKEDLAAKKVEKTEKTEKKKADKKKPKKTEGPEITVTFSDSHRRFDREDRHEKKMAKASVKDETAFPALE